MHWDLAIKIRDVTTTQVFARSNQSVMKTLLLASVILIVVPMIFPARKMATVIHGVPQMQIQIVQVVMIMENIASN